MLHQTTPSYHILHDRPDGVIEGRWRACLAQSDFPTHYTAPEYFLEPLLRRSKPFAILSLAGEHVTGVLTGMHQGDHVQSGLSVRPQVAFSRNADRAEAMRRLIAGLLQEAKSAKLVDLFVWSQMAELIDGRFHKRPYEGVVMMDLAQDSDTIFRKFSAKRRTDIRRVIKSGVSVAPAETGDDLCEFHAIHREWARRKGRAAIGEEEFREVFALGGNRRLLLARYKGRVIAGVVHRFFPGGVMEYAANNSLESALQLRPNDLLQWRAIEWGCAEGLTKYSLGGAHPFLRKFGGEIVTTTRCRLDLSIFRAYTVRDWLADTAKKARPFIPDRLATLARSLRGLAEEPRTPAPKDRV
jgi:Acetyltransferase (GNAT) domain